MGLFDGDYGQSAKRWPLAFTTFISEIFSSSGIRQWDSEDRLLEFAGFS